MSAPGTRTIAWANGEDQFCLSKVGLIFDLESKCNAGIATILRRLAEKEFYLNDVRETIRLGLIGGGMASDKAMAAVKHHVDLNENGLAPSVLLAYAIIEAVLVGVPEDPLGKAAPAADQTTAGISSSTTDASAAPKSSASERASDGRPAKRKT